MATNNRKDNHFFAIFHLFASFSRVSLGKISWNWSTNEVRIYIMKHTNFQKISPKETREKWARVFFFCMFVTPYNFETTTHACVSKALWRHWCVWGESSLQAIFVNIATRFWRWKFRIRNSYPMDRMPSILQWRLLKCNCCSLCFQAAVFVTWNEVKWSEVFIYRG